MRAGPTPFHSSISARTAVRERSSVLRACTWSPFVSYREWSYGHFPVHWRPTTPCGPSCFGTLRGLHIGPARA